MRTLGFTGLALAMFAMLSAPLAAEDFLGMKEGAPKMKSAGPLAFGPFGVLFVGDTKSATVFAIGTGDKAENKNKSQVNVENLHAKVASAVGAGPGEVVLNDLAVNPLSGNIYLSAAKTGAKAGPALLKIDGKGKVTALPLNKISFSKLELPDAPEDKVVQRGRRKQNRRDESITDLAYVDGQLLVSGLSNSSSPSAVRAMQFPFTKASAGANLEIFHAAHGRDENYAAIRTFVPFTIDGEPSLLAGFTCTPLVKFPLKGVTPGGKIKGTTIAELGNRNRPYDMIVYKKDGKNYLLMANSARGVMKISTDNIENNKGLTKPVRGGGVAGQSYETIDDWKGVVQLDSLDDKFAVVVIKTDGGLTLKTVAYP